MFQAGSNKIKNQNKFATSLFII